MVDVSIDTTGSAERPVALSLFREQVLTEPPLDEHGTILITSGTAATVWAVLSAALVVGILLFLTYGSYTRRTRVTGQIVPDLGIINVIPSQQGRIVEKHVAEGQTVHKGDVLFVLSSDHLTSVGSEQETISKQVEARQRSLRVSLLQTRQLDAVTSRSLREQILRLQGEEAHQTESMQVQADRTDLANEVASEYESLYQQQLISADQLRDKHADQLEQRQRLSGLQRDRETSLRQLADLRGQLNEQPLKVETQLGQLERELDVANQDMAESEGRRRIAISSPEDGIATAVVGELEQSVDGVKTIVSIIPRGARLQVHLYAPSRSVGLIQVGDRVVLRYNAYPHEKFGHYGGAVSALARVAIPQSDYGARSEADRSANPEAEPVYRVVVNPDSNTVRAFNREWPLTPGMTVEADVMQESRPLYEWILEPLYAMSGKLR